MAVPVELRRPGVGLMERDATEARRPTGLRPGSLLRRGRSAGARGGPWRRGDEREEGSGAVESSAAGSAAAAAGGRGWQGAGALEKGRHREVEMVRRRGRARGEREMGVERREWGRALAALPGDARLRAMGIAERRWRREGMSRDRGDRARVRGGRGWACLDSGQRLAAAGEAGWVGPSGEEMARGLAGLTSLFSLLYFL